MNKTELLNLYPPRHEATFAPIPSKYRVTFTHYSKRIISTCTRSLHRSATTNKRTTTMQAGNPSIYIYRHTRSNTFALMYGFANPYRHYICAQASCLPWMIFAINLFEPFPHSSSRTWCCLLCNGQKFALMFEWKRALEPNMNLWHTPPAQPLCRVASWFFLLLAWRGFF